MAAHLNITLSSYKGKRDELISLLQHVQAELGYLSEQAMLEIAALTGVPASRVYAVASFYAQFRFTPVGRNKVMVCRGTACHVRGAPRILDEVKRQLGIAEGETTRDMEYTLETVACIGCCGLSPCLMINKKVETKMTPKRVAELFTKGKKDDQRL